MLNEAGRLKPKFYWIERILGSYEPGVLPATCVFIFTVSCSCIFAILQWGGRAVYHPNGPEWWLAVLLTFLVAVSLISESITVALFLAYLSPICFPSFNYLALVLIAVHNQSTEGLRFKVPWVPTLPALSIAANVALMVNLNPMTWIRFAIWMSIGMCLPNIAIQSGSREMLIKLICRIRHLLCIRNATQQRKRRCQFLLRLTEIQLPVG